MLINLTDSKDLCNDPCIENYFLDIWGGLGFILNKAGYLGNEVRLVFTIHPLNGGIKEEYSVKYYATPEDYNVINKQEFQEKRAKILSELLNKLYEPPNF